MMTDPVADFLTRIRNANSVGKDRVEIPVSKLKAGICKVLKEEGLSLLGWREVPIRPEEADIGPAARDASQSCAIP